MARQPTPDGNPVNGDRPPAGVQQIGIAVVEHQSHLLVGLRRADQVLAGYSEFPGGKCRSGESDRDCVVRECREETGLDVELVEQLDCIEYTYPHGHVRLSFWLCRPAPQSLTRKSGLPVLYSGFDWHPVTNLARLNFPDANASVLEKLRNRYAAVNGHSE